MNESTLEELEKLGNRRIPKTEEERKDQNEEKLCKSIIKGLARRHREKHAIFAEIEEGKQHVMCIDDVTGKELPWHEVRKARGQELKYLCDFRAYEKVDEREAIAQCHFTPVDTKWVDTDESFEKSYANQITNCCKGSKVTIGQICAQGLLRWKR